MWIFPLPPQHVRRIALAAARRFGAQESDHEDIAQEVSIRVMRVQLRSEEAAGVYVYRAARNALKSLYRRQARQPQQAWPEEHALESGLFTHADQESACYMAELLAELEGLAHTPKMMSAARALIGTHRGIDVALEEGVSGEAVSKRVRKLRERLRLAR